MSPGPCYARRSCVNPLSLISEFQYRKLVISRTKRIIVEAGRGVGVVTVIPKAPNYTTAAGIHLGRMLIGAPTTEMHTRGRHFSANSPEPFPL